MTISSISHLNGTDNSEEQDLNKLKALWNETFYEELASKSNNKKSDLIATNLDKIFPLDYKHKFSPEFAIIDLNYLKLATTEQKLKFNLETSSAIDFKLKIYSPSKSLALSDILPLIENLGFKAIDEQSFEIKAEGDIEKSWIYYFILAAPAAIERNPKELKANIEDALDKIALGLLSSDSLSKLVVLSSFNWQQVKLLKALTRYLHQTGFTYGKGYVQLMLIKHFQYTELLMSLFTAKFDLTKHSEREFSSVKAAMLQYLDNVESSAEDKVLRSMLELIEAIIRTNYYQLDPNGVPKNYISFKFDSSKVPGLPRPLPYAEIYVYSNDFEGIHLRGGKVARGGIRWSDRGEDYRTEVLGLMKAQMTKNAVIVPVGSKGGFFVKLSAEGLTRPVYMDAVITCYKNFLRGLLDLTDNIVEHKVIHPEGVVIYDAADPYLVVAADKGTATFSDYANSVSAEYNFWLGDAFASGGSAGYDHKKMAITAKGAWISVTRHFAAMGIDVQKDPITVVGIGDMSGDVFGNGMLLSNSIKLVGAFNHKHIFIDPTPDPQISFAERQRLFNLPMSSWSDYDVKLISQGGGVFERNAKLITLSSEIRELLEIESTEIAPDDLIKVLLTAKVDLIWNGGIGTYFKASTETHLDIGDKANDGLRCNAKDIKAKVIAEGGNIGVSQQARIEYSKLGGLINTDFIDNSAGVDCSDHEVNIKIILNQAVTAGKLSLEERNKLLASMTQQVEKLVLADNHQQNQAITIAQLSPALSVEIFSHLITSLEEEKLLDRKVEFLPDEAELNRRSIAKERMTRPELAMLLSYSKMSVYNDLVHAKLTEDKYFESYLVNYFPPLMQEQFRSEILAHPLRQEIIRTIITNKIVNQLGGPIINNIKRETGAALCNIIRSYTIVCEIFNLDYLWQSVENLPTNVDHSIKIDMFTELEKIMRRGSSWFVRNLEQPINIEQTIKEFKEPAERLSHKIATLLAGEAKSRFDARLKKYSVPGVNLELANSIAILDSLVSAFDIIFVAKQTTAQDTDVANLYFASGNKFNIDWLRRTAEKHLDDSYWNRLSIQSLKDDLYGKQRLLLIKMINQLDSNLSINPTSILETWIEKNKDAASIFIDFIEDIKLQENINLHMVLLANKKFEIFLNKLP